MELSYELTVEDYMEYSYFFADITPRIRRTRLINRCLGPVCFVLAILINFYYSTLNVIYTILALLWFVSYPKYEHIRLKKQTKSFFKNPEKKAGLGEKTLTVEDGCLIIKGYETTDILKFEDIISIECDENHFYIFIDEMSAFIVPFGAFKDDGSRTLFGDILNQKIIKNRGN